MSVAANAGDRARLDPARRRAATAKRALAAATILGFAVTLGLARESHPGQASSSSSGGQASLGLDVGRPERRRLGLRVRLGFDRRVVGRRRRLRHPRLVAAMVLGSTMAWYAARAGGMVAFVVLTVGVLLGLGLSGRARLKEWPRFAVEDVHRFVGLLAGDVRRDRTCSCCCSRATCRSRSWTS